MKHEKPGKKPKRTKTPEEEAHLNWVSSLPCSVQGCSNAEVCVHHIREHGEYKNHFKTIPLCWDHHQGPNGIHHMGRKAWESKYGLQLDMLKQLMERKDG